MRSRPGYRARRCFRTPRHNGLRWCGRIGVRGSRIVRHAALWRDKRGAVIGRLRGSNVPCGWSLNHPDPSEAGRKRSNKPFVVSSLERFGGQGLASARGVAVLSCCVISVIHFGVEV